MFGLSTSTTDTSVSCCFISEEGYSLVGLERTKSIAYCENHYFKDTSPVSIEKTLSDDVKNYNLYGKHCQVILSPALYQLVLMDAPQVPENELVKALRWQLKGLIDYPLNDILVDAFVVPPHGAGFRRKKVLCSVTVHSSLVKIITQLENCLLQVTGVSIAELALSHLVSNEIMSSESPFIVISYDNNICQLHVYYKRNLYLLRTLSMSKSITQPNSPANQDMLLEIQRSIDYCLMELKLSEPQHVLFTPSFYEASDLFSFLQIELDKQVTLMEANSFFSSPPIPPEMMAKTFYALGGLLMLLNGKA